MKGFKNVDVYVEGKGIIKTSLGVEDGKIVYIGKDDENIEPYFEAEKHFAKDFVSGGLFGPVALHTQ